MNVWFGLRTDWLIVSLAAAMIVNPGVSAEESAEGRPIPAPPQPAASETAGQEDAGPTVPEALKQIAQAPEAPAPTEAEPSEGGPNRGIRWSGSGELLGWTTLSGSMKQGIWNRSNTNTDFIITHFHPKLTAPLGPRAFAYAELCITHPRVGPQPEQAYIEYGLSERLNFQAGRFLVPFGQWNQIHDVFDHKSIAYPLMYLGHEEEELALQGGPRPIVSTAFSDIGVLAYGSFWPGPDDQIWYGGYVSNGRFGGTDIEWLDLWNSVRDNNSDKAYGGRLVWSHGDNLSLGASYQTGRYDVDNRLRYRFAGVDAYYRLADKVNVRAEYVRNPVDSFVRGYTKTGWWVSADMPIGSRHEVVLTHSRLKQSPAQRVEKLSRTTVGLNRQLTRSLKLKTELDFLDIGSFVGDPTDASDTQFGTSFEDTTRLRASLVAIF